MDPVAREYAARCKSLAHKIEKKWGVKRDLDVLDKAGVPRDRMLLSLAATVDKLKNGSGDLAELARDTRDELRSRAKQMDAFARKLDKALDDPSLKVQFWTYVVGYGALLGMKLPAPPLWRNVAGVPLVPAGLHVLAEQFRKEARLLGRLLREFARKDAQAPVAFLLMWVYIFRRRRDPKAGLDHLDVLARLLTDAIEVAGINKYGRPRGQSPERDNYFTEVGLRKVWERQGRRLYGRWLRLLKQTLNPPSANWQKLNRLASQPAGSSASSQTPGGYASFLGSLPLLLPPSD
jgi:hypothetical protein